MAAIAPFGTDDQPNTRAVIRGGKLMIVPSYSSQRERSAKIAREYSGDVPYFPPSVRQEVNQPLWAKRSPLPPIKPNSGLGGPITMRETERSDGTYMDGVKWTSEKINSQSDMSYAVQLKLLLEDWPRDNLKKIYLAIAEKHDLALTDQVYRGTLADICIAYRLPLTQRAFEKLMDRFSKIREPNNVDYKKLLVFLDTVYEVTDYAKKRDKNTQLAFPLPAADQEQNLFNSELSQTFRKVQEDPGDEHATEGHLRSRSHENIESKKGHPLNEGNVPKEKQKEFPGTEEIVEARSQIGFRGEGDAGVPNEHKHVDFAAESRTQSPSSNSKIDAQDAELLALLVSHLSKKGRNINLKAIKQACYDADLDKSTFIFRGKTKDILRRNAVSLDDWLLDALLNRCDIDNTGNKTCWIAVIEFLERVQPFTLKKSLVEEPVSPHKRAPTTNPITNNVHVRKDIDTKPNPPSDRPLEVPANASAPQQQVDHYPDTGYDYSQLEQAPIFNPSDGDVQSRAENLFRALKSVDLDKTGMISADEALRLVKSYNAVYHLGMDEFDVMRHVQNATYQGKVVIDSLCSSIHLERTA